jgi:hypothetical protein
VAALDSALLSVGRETAFPTPLAPLSPAEASVAMGGKVVSTCPVYFIWRIHDELYRVVHK